MGLSKKALRMGSAELRKLASLQHAMKMQNGLLRVRLAIQNQARWLTLCLSALGALIIWETHRQVHAGMMKTLSRVKIIWYWPDMARDVRQLVGSCEAC